MKYLLSFFFLLTCFLQAQTDKPSNVFINLAEIEQPPTYVGCENQEFEACSFDKITSYFKDQVDPKIIDQITPEERIINLKFIVDSSGKVRRAMAQAKNEALKNETNRILQQLPDFNPGIHEGEKVNVIMDLFLELENTSQLIGNSDLLDSHAYIAKCKDDKIPVQCSSRWTQDFVNTNLDDSKIKTKGVNLKTIVNFVVDEEGQVTKVIAEGPDNDLNMAAEKVIKQLPVFIPATRNNKNVQVSLKIPIIVFLSS